MPKIIEISLPEYTIAHEPDHKQIGKLVDDKIREHFQGQVIVARGVSSKEHDKSLNELAEIIKHTGTDRYDPARAGDRYDNVKGKHIDLFAFRRKVTPRMDLFRHISWGFYHGAKAVHGKPVRIDIVTIYDAAQLQAVVHQYEGRDDIKRDGYKFKDPANKARAVIGIIKIL